MKIYSVTSHDIGGGRYPWASGYRPLETMPFFDDFPSGLKESFRQFWDVNPGNPGMSIDPGGKIWSHVIGCGGGPPGEFFSEQVIADLLENKVQFLRATEMPITKILAKKLLTLPAPKYYVLEATPGLEIWSDAIPIEEQIAARNEHPPRLVLPYLTKCRISSWNGADLFSPAHGRSQTAIFCTERIKELAERKGWTNANFTLVETV